MRPLQVPRHGDAVIRQDKRDGTPCYILYAEPGPDQYLIHTRDGAVAHALAFARRAHVHAWFTSGEGLFELLGKIGAVEVKEDGPASPAARSAAA